MKCVSCVVQCLLKCLEEVVEYINKLAYAFMSISGQRFCRSAYNGLLLSFRHGGKFAFGNYLAYVFVLLGKIGITILNIFITWTFMKRVTGVTHELSNPYGPLFIVGLTSYMIVSVFLGIFDESVLAMMTCATADLDMNDNIPEWGPASLHKVINNMEDPDEDKLNTSTYSNSSKRSGRTYSDSGRTYSNSGRTYSNTGRT